MALPNIFTLNLTTSNVTAIVNAQGTATGTLTLVSTTVVLDVQRQINFTCAGNESGNTFTIVGLNQANMTITDTITGPNTGTAVSHLDFKTIKSISLLTTSAGTISVGTNGIGSSLWNVVDWYADPVNISCGVVVQSGSANWSVQYTYDNPNNLPSGVTAPTAFTHATLVAQTGNLDGQITAPVAAVRLLINSGTGTIRGTFTQAGVGW